MLEKTIAVLENEKPYRKGGLLDFSESEKPLIIIPDIHSRDYFLKDILDFRFSGEISEHLSGLTVYEALESEELFVVCVGDGMHSENQGKTRWSQAYFDYAGGNYTGNAMQEEMTENLRVLQICCELKQSFPKNFHFLKGNHENITNESGNGNRAFRKFCDEGNMTTDFIRNFYDDIALYMIELYEKNLPLLALFKNAVVSHAEPNRIFSKRDIQGYKKTPELTESVVFGLTWTQNSVVQDKTCIKSEKKLFGKKYHDNIFWFGGHRPVTEKFKSRQDGKYIQIHNPFEENVAFVAADRVFDPVTDIFPVK